MNIFIELPINKWSVISRVLNTFGISIFLWWFFYIQFMRYAYIEISKFKFSVTYKFKYNVDQSQTFKLLWTWKYFNISRKIQIINKLVCLKRKYGWNKSDAFNVQKAQKARIHLK